MDFFSQESPRPREQPGERWARPGGGEVALFVGELAEAPAEVLCTSTNPRLSLLGGTGAAIIERAGWGVRREASAIVQRAAAEAGKPGLEIGTVHRTTAGALPHAFVLHCVVSEPGYAVSTGAIRSCVRGALAEAERAGSASIALPVFGAGHASFPFDRAVRAIGEELAAIPAAATRRVLLVVFDPDRVAPSRDALDAVLPRSGTARA